MTNTKTSQIGRRAFLQGATAIAGGLALGKSALAQASVRPLALGQWREGRWMRVSMTQRAKPLGDVRLTLQTVRGFDDVATIRAIYPGGQESILWVAPPQGVAKVRLTLPAPRGVKLALERPDGTRDEFGVSQTGTFALMAGAPRWINFALNRAKKSDPLEAARPYLLIEIESV